MTQWTWVWVNSGSWRWTGRPGELQSTSCKESDTTERLNLTELNWILCIYIHTTSLFAMYGALVAGKAWLWGAAPGSSSLLLETLFCTRPDASKGTQNKPLFPQSSRGYKLTPSKTPRNCSYLNLQLNKSIKRQKIMSNFYLHFQPKLQVIPLPVYSRHIQSLLF